MKQTLLIMFLVIVIVLIVLKKNTSTLQQAQPAPSPSSPDSILSKPMYDASGNYQDVDINSGAGGRGFKNNITLDPGNPSWAEANQICWDKGNQCYGIRHDFDTKQTWYLSKDPTGKTDTSVLSALTPTVEYNGQSYSLPLAIVALKSVSDPTVSTNCEWTENVPPCAAAACGVSGTPVSTTWTKSKEASRTGTCAPAPASRSIPCPAGPACPTPCVWTESTPACVTPKCNTPGTPVQTSWSITTPASNGGACGPSPASTSVSCPAGPQCPWIPFGSLNRSSPAGSPVSTSSPAPSPRASPAPQPSNPLDSYNLVDNHDTYGNDLLSYDVTPTACATYCSGNASCSMFVVSTNGPDNGKSCWLKSVGALTANQPGGKPNRQIYIKKAT